MKIIDYRYKVRLTKIYQHERPREFSISEFLKFYDSCWASRDRILDSRLEIINREKNKVIYEILCKGWDFPPLFILEDLYRGVPESEALPKNKFITLGELINSKNSNPE